MLLLASAGLCSTPADAPEFAPFDDAALTPEDRARLVETVPGILAERRSALSNVVVRARRDFAGHEDSFQRDRISKRLEIAFRLCDFAAGQHALGDVSGLAFAQRALDDLNEFERYFDEEFEAWERYPRPDVAEKPVVL